MKRQSSFIFLFAIFTPFFNGCATVSPNAVYTPSSFATVQPSYVGSEIIAVFERQQVRSVTFDELSSTSQSLNTGEINKLAFSGNGTVVIEFIDGNSEDVEIAGNATLITTPDQILVIK